MSTRDDDFAGAEATHYLAGARIHPYNESLALLSLIGALVTIACLTLSLTRVTPFAGPVLFFSAIAIVVLLFFWRAAAVSAVRINNDGVVRLAAGDNDGATAHFRRVSSGFHGRDVVAIGLHNLAIIALRKEEPDAAVLLLRAAHSATVGFRLPSVPNEVGTMALSHLGFALAAIGELDEAQIVVDRIGETSVATAVAYGVRARAYVALLRGRAEDALAILDSERMLLRNVLTGNEAILAEAMESLARERTGAAGEAVFADEEAKAYVSRYLPEAVRFLSA